MLVNKLQEYKHRYGSDKKLQYQFLQNSRSMRKTQANYVREKEHSAHNRIQNNLKTNKIADNFLYGMFDNFHQDRNIQENKTIKKFSNHQSNELTHKRKKGIFNREPAKNKQNFSHHTVCQKTVRTIKFNQFNRQPQQHQQINIHQHKQCSPKSNNPSTAMKDKQEQPKINSTSKNNKKIQLQYSQGGYEFMEKLAFNSVFFCSFCYRYVFAVEKYLHYPECKNDNKGEDSYRFGWERINMIQQLSAYTKTKLNLIQEKIKFINQKIYVCQQELLLIPKYLKLEEIDKALQIIFQQLIQPSQQYKENEEVCGMLLTDNVNEI